MLPIFVPSFRAGPPVTEFALQGHLRDKNYRFLSYRLIPGYERVELSSSRKLRRLLHTSSVPRLGVEYVIEAPIIIQLGNGGNGPLPFRIWAVPDWSQASWDTHGIPQTISVDSIRFRIVAETEGKKQSYWAFHMRPGLGISSS